MLGRQQFGQLIHIGLNEAFELEHHPRAALGIGRGPAVEGVLGGLDGAIHLGHRGQLDAGLDLTGVGVEHVRVAARGTGEGRAVDEMVDVAHDRKGSWRTKQSGRMGSGLAPGPPLRQRL